MASITDITCRPILLVDDNKMNQMIMKKAVESNGFVPEQALDGAPAIQKVIERILAGSPYILIFMDAEMPLDGGTATKHILDMCDLLMPLAKTCGTQKIEDVFNKIIKDTGVKQISELFLADGEQVKSKILAVYKENDVEHNPDYTFEDVHIVAQSNSKRAVFLEIFGKVASEGADLRYKSRVSVLTDPKNSEECIKFSTKAQFSKEMHGKITDVQKKRAEEASQKTHLKDSKHSHSADIVAKITQLNLKDKEKTEKTVLKVAEVDETNGAKSSEQIEEIK